MRTTKAQTKDVFLENGNRKINRIRKKFRKT